MTVKRDLKRRVRERQAETGESYTTALRQVLLQRRAAGGAIPVLELLDATVAGTQEGIACRVSIFPDVLTDGTEGDAAQRVLGELVRVLRQTDGDPALSLMRQVVLRGERARLPADPRVVDRTGDFLRRTCAGLGGVSPSGHMLAMAVGGRLLVFTLSLTPSFVAADRAPLLVVSLPRHLVGHLPLGGPSTR